jgi:Mg/Co/Ni transporter MgtE
MIVKWEEMNKEINKIDELKPSIKEICLGSLLALFLFLVGFAIIYWLIPEDYQYNPMLFGVFMLSVMAASTLGKTSQMMIFRRKIQKLNKEKDT